MVWFCVFCATRPFLEDKFVPSFHRGGVEGGGLAGLLLFDAQPQRRNKQTCTAAVGVCSCFRSPDAAAINAIKFRNVCKYGTAAACVLLLSRSDPLLRRVGDFYTFNKLNSDCDLFRNSGPQFLQRERLSLEKICARWRKQNPQTRRPCSDEQSYYIVIQRLFVVFILPLFIRKIL